MELFETVDIDFTVNNLNMIQNILGYITQKDELEYVSNIQNISTGVSIL